MINKINTISSNYITNFKGIKNQQVNIQNTEDTSIPKDTISFKGKTRTVEKNVLEMLQDLEKSTPVIGFKGDGIWVLPNLKKIAGQKFNLYLPDGRQISYQKGQAKDNVIFTLKTSAGKEKTKSKIKLPERDSGLESKRLIKTKEEKILTFRVNTKDAKPRLGDYKAGEISKIETNPDGTLSETTKISDKEFKQINEVLDKYLKKFF